MIKSLREKLLNDTELSNLLGTKIYPNRASQPADKPYCTISEISVDPERCTSGLAGVAQTGIQLDVWSYRYADIETIRNAIRRVVDGLQGENMGDVYVRSIRVETQFDDVVAPTDGSDRHTHRKSIDIYIWHDDVLT